MRPSRLASTTSSQTDIHCPSIALGECEDNADSQTLSPGNRTRSPWTMANRTVTASMWAAQMSRVAMGESDFDTGGELSDLEFLGMSAEEYEASAPVVAMNRGGGFVGFRSRSCTLVRVVGMGWWEALEELEVREEEMGMKATLLAGVYN